MKVPSDIELQLMKAVGQDVEPPPADSRVEKLLEELNDNLDELNNKSKDDNISNMLRGHVMLGSWAYDEDLKAWISMGFIDDPSGILTDDTPVILDLAGVYENGSPISAYTMCMVSKYWAKVVKAETYLDDWGIVRIKLYSYENPFDVNADLPPLETDLNVLVVK